MKQFLLCSLLVIAAATCIQATPAPVKSPAPPDHSIELQIPVSLLDSAIAEKPEPKSLSPYAAAYAAAQESGRLIVLVCMEGCRPCVGAKAEFAKRAEGRADCVMLDYHKDAEAREILSDWNGVPAVVVFERRGDQWQRLTYGGSKADFEAVFGSTGLASVAAECLCDKCPDNCPSNDCKCSASAKGAQATGVYGTCLTRGQPVRNTVKAVVGVAKWVKQKQPVRSCLRRLCGRCR